MITEGKPINSNSSSVYFIKSTVKRVRGRDRACEIKRLRGLNERVI